jgi:vacuolar-type H+-ATPase subunit H
LVLRVKGSEAWSYDTVCALCNCMIGPDQDVYVVGMHVFHGECLEWLLKQPEHKFREVLKHLPLDTHEELKKLRAEKKLPTPPPPKAEAPAEARSAPPGPGPSTGAETSGGGERYREIVELVRRAREVYLDAYAKYEQLDSKSWEFDEELSRLYDRLIDIEREFDEAVKRGDTARARDLLAEAESTANRFKELLKAADEFNDRALKEWESIREKAASQISDIIKSAPEPVRAKIRRSYIGALEERPDPISVYGLFQSHYSWAADSIVEKLRETLKYAEKKSPGTSGESQQKPAQASAETGGAGELPDPRVLTREERRVLWSRARAIVDSALKETGLRYVGEMRVDGMAPEPYSRFLLTIRDKVSELLKEPRRVEFKVQTYLKGYADTDIYLDGEYLGTWRPVEPYIGAFWNWVHRVYNLLKELAERELLKEDVFKE